MLFTDSFFICYICRGIATHITSPFTSAHIRGILIFAVGLLPISRVHSLRPLKRHSDICCGIAAYIACSLSMPTQEAFWYLPWDCYLYRTSPHYAQSWEILIFPVGPFTFLLQAPGPLVAPFKGTVPTDFFFIRCFYAIMHRTTIVQNKILSIISSCFFFCWANIYRPSLGKVR